MRRKAVLGSVLTKICTDCKEEKALKQFWPFIRGKYGRYSKCGVCMCTRRKAYRAKDRQKWKIYARKWAQNLRREVLKEYGHMCVCCGEMRYEFLAMDHTHNDGAAHRAAVGEGYKIYMDIKRRGFPKDSFRVLCHNCNQARGYYGYCPHEKEREHAGLESKLDQHAILEGASGTSGLVLWPLNIGGLSSSPGTQMVAVS